MRSVNLKVFSIAVFLMIASCGVCFAEGTPMDRIAADLEKIQSRLENIEKQQQEIIAKEVEIRAELDRIRMWVHRK